MSGYRTNDGEFQPKRVDLGVSGLSLFQTETGVTPPKPAPATGEQHRDRIVSALEAKRKDYIDRIHRVLLTRFSLYGYDILVSANDARAIYLSFPDADPSIDFRFLAALWRKPGWVQVDMNGRSNAPDNHARRIARYRYEP